MVSVRRRGARARQHYHSGHLTQLRTGHDFFHDAWGAAPHSQETLADMRTAWAGMQDAVKDRHRRHWGDDRPTWAAKQFDEA